MRGISSSDDAVPDRAMRINECHALAVPMLESALAVEPIIKKSPLPMDRRDAQIY